MSQNLNIFIKHDFVGEEAYQQIGKCQYIFSNFVIQLWTEAKTGR